MSEPLEIARQVVDAARRAGAAEAEAYVVDGQQLQTKVNQGEIDFLKEAQTRGVGVRVVADARTSLVHSSDLRPHALEELARRAVHLTTLVPPDEHAGLPPRAWTAAPDDLPDLELFDPAVAQLSAEEQIATAHQMEAAATSVDARVKRTQLCQVTRHSGRRALASSHGAELEYVSTAISLYVGALAVDADGRQQSWYEGGTWRQLQQIPEPAALGGMAAREALRRLGPRQIDSQRVPVVMHANVASDWIEKLAGAFSGEEVLKNASYLSDKHGTSIAAPCVTLVNDGLRPAGVGSEPFDGEGIAPRRTLLIDAGVCRSFLYDARTARRAGTQATGSAMREYNTAPSIGTHNLYLEPGDATLEELLAEVERGFYYVDSGAFGYNPTTGDYSFQAAGFWIENGELAHPVDEITVTSNSLDMLRNIERLGVEMPWRGATCAPALRIGEMTVGK